MGRRLRAALAGVAAFVAAAVGAGAAAQAQTASGLSPEDRVLYLEALDATRKYDWDKALGLAARGRHALASDYIRWLYYVAPGAKPDFDDVAGFIDTHGDWPRQEAMLRNAEALLVERPESDDDFVRDWFARHAPVSAEGKARLGEALLRDKQLDKGHALLREAWIEGDFSAADERTLLRRHRQLFTREDHAARLDRLLWERERTSAKRLLPYVAPDVRTLGIARLGLMESAGNVDTLIARVPDSLREHPGLALERARWRRNKGFDGRAREILLSPRGHEMEPSAWWRERRIQVRSALYEDLATDAYVVATLSDLEPGGADYAEAEWLAGWIALRFLDEASLALDHFARMHYAVEYPVSVARAAYWAGRAAAALDDAPLARAWYQDAARYPLTYHGQLALREIGEESVLRLPEEPRPTIAEADAFPGREMARMARLLADLGASDRAAPFILELDSQVETAGERVLVAVLADSIGRRDLAVRVSKNATRDGVYIMSRAYPVIELPTKYVADTALLLAMSRQESAFDPEAVSHAGARGLMQLMPATARRTARSIGMPYSPTRLTSDAEYNALLGSAHMNALLEEFEGEAALALAAYNAGEGRVRRWLEQNGDPRRGEVDLIDWIELIPFTETRDYVHRVLGNWQVYRTLLEAGEDAKLRLTSDMMN